MPAPPNGQIEIWWTPCAGRGAGRAHDSLRRILSRYGGGGEVDVRRDRWGKLHPTGGGLSVSLSYAGEWAVCAVARGVDIGVDCEAEAPLRDFAEVAALCFAPAERAALSGGAPGEQLALFYRVWTRKEAVVKALGLGLSYPVATLSVPREALAEPVPVEAPGEGRLWVCDLPAPPGCTAACASRAPFSVRLRRSWTSPRDLDDAAAQA